MIETAMRAHLPQLEGAALRPVLAMGALCLGALGWLAPEWVFTQATALDSSVTSRGLELLGVTVVVVCSLIATSLAGIVTLSPRAGDPPRGASAARLHSPTLGVLPPITFVGTALAAHGLNDVHGLPPILVVTLGALVQFAVGIAGSLLWQLSRRALARMVSLLPQAAADRLSVALLSPRRCPSPAAPTTHTTLSRRGPPLTALASL